MKIPADFKYPGFYDLLCDAIFQHRMAVNEEDSYAMNRFARASIISSALVIESCGNCLLSDLDIPKKLYEELDKLPVLAKYETYLRLNEISDFKRGDHRVERVVELIKLRNDFVHPKVNNIKTEIGKLEDMGHKYLMPMELTGEQWKALKIPKRGLFWSADCAKAVLGCVSEFLVYIFSTLLNKSDDDVQYILMSRVEFSNVCIPTTFDVFANEIEQAKSIGIDFSFLTSNSPNKQRQSDA